MWHCIQHTYYRGSTHMVIGCTKHRGGRKSPIQFGNTHVCDIVYSIRITGVPHIWWLDVPNTEEVGRAQFNLATLTYVTLYTAYVLPGFHTYGDWMYQTQRRQEEPNSIWQHSRMWHCIQHTYYRGSTHMVIGCTKHRGGRKSPIQFGNTYVCDIVYSIRITGVPHIWWLDVPNTEEVGRAQFNLATLTYVTLYTAYVLPGFHTYGDWMYQTQRRQEEPNSIWQYLRMWHCIQHTYYRGSTHMVIGCTKHRGGRKSPIQFGNTYVCDIVYSIRITGVPHIWWLDVPNTEEVGRA